MTVTGGLPVRLREICCDCCPLDPTCEEENDFLTDIGLADEWGEGYERMSDEPEDAEAPPVPALMAADTLEGGRQVTETIPPGMQKWLQREARMCGMSADVIIAAALAEYRARRTPEDRLRFRDGTPNYHHRNVEFTEDEDAGR